MYFQDQIQINQITGPDNQVQGRSESAAMDFRLRYAGAYNPVSGAYTPPPSEEWYWFFEKNKKS
jgi:hypothetical protein